LRTSLRSTCLLEHVDREVPVVKCISDLGGGFLDDLGDGPVEDT
jgi:hypothetical protein